MPTSHSKFAIADHFAAAAPIVRATYDAILRAARSFGTVREEPKKTSIHLVRTSAFAGVATRKASLILTLKSDRAVDSPRIRRSERASANRWHVEIPLSGPNEVDGELRAWMARAYELS